MALRALISKIHPPLSLTQRECQQLLSMLNASFTRHLDANFEPSTPSKVKQQPRQWANGKDDRRRSTPSEARQGSSVQSANQHFHALLLHPVLAPVGLQHVDAATSTPRAGGVGESDRPEPARQRNHDVRAWLDQRAVELAALCFDAHTRAIKSRSLPSVADDMRRSQAGTKMLRRLQPVMDTRFELVLHHHAIVCELTPFLVAEHRHDLIWDWFHRAGRFRTRSAQGHLLEVLVRAELNHGAGLESAINLYLKAVRLNSTAPRPDFLSTRAELEPALRPAAKFLGKRCMRATMTISAPLLERFCQSIRLWSSGYQYICARILSGYVTQRQEPLASLAWFRDNPSWPVRASAGEVRARTVIVQLGLLTAERLLEQDRLADGSWLMEFLREKFPVELGLSADTAPDGSPRTVFQTPSLPPPSDKAARKCSHQMVPLTSQSDEEMSLKLLEDLRVI